MHPSSASILESLIDTVIVGSISVDIWRVLVHITKAKLKELCVVVDLVVSLECPHEPTVLVGGEAATKVDHFGEVVVLLVHVDHSYPTVVVRQEKRLCHIGDTIIVVEGLVVLAPLVDIVGDHTNLHVVVGAGDIVYIGVHRWVLDRSPIIFCIYWQQAHVFLKV